MNVLDQISELKGRLNYVNNVLNAGGLELWEAKEYTSLQSDYITEIQSLELHVQNNIEIFS